MQGGHRATAWCGTGQRSALHHEEEDGWNMMVKVASVRGICGSHGGYGGALGGSGEQAKSPAAGYGEVDQGSENGSRSGCDDGVGGRRLVTV